MFLQDIIKFSHWRKKKWFFADYKCMRIMTKMMGFGLWRLFTAAILLFHGFCLSEQGTKLIIFPGIIFLYFKCSFFFQFLHFVVKFPSAHSKLIIPKFWLNVRSAIIWYFSAFTHFFAFLLLTFLIEVLASEIWKSS